MSKIFNADLRNNPLQNFLINGNFDFWQRGVTFASIAWAYSADRWKIGKEGAGAFTALRSTDVPTFAQSGTLSQYSLHMDVTTADASIGAEDQYSIQQVVEGSVLAGFAGKAITLSFWVKATKTGISCVGFTNSNGTRTYVAEYTINTTNTWEKKTITLTHDTSGTWGYDTSPGVVIRWALASGTDMRTTPNAWNSVNALATSSQVNHMDSTANDFRIAQVMLNIGNEAAPFALFGKTVSGEMSACQRYYEKSSPVSIFPGAASLAGCQGFILGAGIVNGSYFQVNTTYRVDKRAIATPVIWAASSASVPNTVSIGSVTRAATPVDIGSTGFSAIQNNSGITWTDGVSIQFHFAADAEM